MKKKPFFNKIISGEKLTLKILCTHSAPIRSSVDDDGFFLSLIQRGENL